MKTLTNKTITATIAAVMLTTVAMPITAASAAAQCLPGDPASASIEQRVRTTIMEVLDLDDLPATIMNLQDDLGASALDIAELSLEIEDEFGIELPDSQIAIAENVIGWIGLVESHCE